MRVMICGADGYLGWPLVLHLLARGHQVMGIDNLTRRRRAREVDCWTATPIASPQERYYMIHEDYPDFDMRIMDVLDYVELEYVLKTFNPEAIVHLAEIPSAPYSMIDREHCNLNMTNNIIGTLNILWGMKKHNPKCHLIKLGTMGEWGQPNIDIPEGFFEIEYRGRRDTLPFPKQAGSFYHLTKVHDSNNIMFACKTWNLSSTDIMQGVVHGVLTEDMKGDERLITRFDFEECWGTALNRFVAQAVVGHKITPYGGGGQTRGYIALRDSIQCMTIAIENPPAAGEYRVLNQFSECYSVNELAEHVVKISKEFGIDAKIWNIPNPRVEKEQHYYNPDHEKLKKLGFKPTHSLDDELRITIPTILKYKSRIEARRHKIMPTIDWREGRKNVSN